MSCVHTWLNVCHCRAGCVHNRATETQNRMRACLARDVNINERVRAYYTCYAPLDSCVRSCSWTMEIPVGPIGNRNSARPLQAYGKQKQGIERARTPH